MTDALKNLVSATSEFHLYASPNGALKVRVLFEDEAVWLTQKAAAELLGVRVPANSTHLENYCESGGGLSA